MRIFATIALSTAALLAAPAFAAEPTQPLDAAWKAAMMDQEGVLTKGQHATVNSIAYHAAASRLCDGLDLDVDKVGAAMDELAAGSGEDMDDGHRLERLTHVLVTLGTAKGLFLAEGSLDTAKFCAKATASKGEKDNDHFFK